MIDVNRRMRDVVRKQANAGQRAHSIAMKRKEEYLGARVPKELREKVLRRAEELGIPFLGNIPLSADIAAMNERGDIAFLQNAFEETARTLVYALEELHE